MPFFLFILGSDCTHFFHFSAVLPKCWLPKASHPSLKSVRSIDNGKFHQSSSLKIPDNILLIFQPPYSPELNPIERIWSHIKQELSWEISKDLDGLKEKVGAFLGELSTEEIASIAGWDYILSALATIA